MYGTWVGLKRVSGSPTDWTWLTYPKPTTQAEKDIKFNRGVTYWDNTNEAASGDCGLAAYTTISTLVTSGETYRAGFYAANCNSVTATAICMKCLSCQEQR